jgi:hypothetical protein
MMNRTRLLLIGFIFFQIQTGTLPPYIHKEKRSIGNCRYSMWGNPYFEIESDYKAPEVSSPLMPGV